LLESVPIGEAESAELIKQRSSSRGRTPTDDSTSDKPKTKTRAGSAPPSRWPRLFGRPSAAPPVLPRARGNSTPDDSIKLEPRSDPAADAALKRRLESQAKDAVGTRARSIEVRVVDRQVHIRAKVDRFWNRRPVRRALESLPALSGYKTTVDVED
jgi:hypothetical protein